MFRTKCLFFAFLCLIFPLWLQAQRLDLNRLGFSADAGGSAKSVVIHSFGNNVNGVQLQAAFTSSGNARAWWDFPIHLDLRQMAAIRIRYRLHNSVNAGQFNLYIKAGTCWYVASFSPDNDTLWHEQIIPKTAFVPEKYPIVSWSDSAILRICIWKGQPQTITWQVAEIEFLKPNISVVLLRNNSNQQTAKEASNLARHLSNSLMQRGVYPAVIDDIDCTSQLLRPYQLVLLPYLSPNSSSLQNQLLTYLRQGGHLGAFHTLPPPIAAKMQFPAGKFTRSSSLPAPIEYVKTVPGTLPNASGFRQMSDAFIAVKPVPANLKVNAWWCDSAGRSTGYPALLQSASGFWMTHTFMNQDPDNAACTLISQMERFANGIFAAGAQNLLAQVSFAIANSPNSSQKSQLQNQMNSAQQMYNSKNYVSAGKMALQVKSALSTPSQAVKTKPNEIRACWCRSAQGLRGHSWRETAKLLKQYKFNYIFPHLADGATGISPFLNDCILACRENNLKLHVWLSCLGLPDAGTSIIQSLSKQKRLQLDETGAEVQALCPTQQINRKNIVDTAVKLAGTPGVAGVHLDFIRYHSSQTCFCPTCHAKFLQFIKQKQINWPNDVKRGGKYYQSWLDFRRTAITSLVQEITQAILQKNSATLISAAVYPDWQNARNNVGQDWLPWIQQKKLSFICPMNYHPNTGQFTADLQRQISQTGNARVILPGIGVTTERLSLDELQKQINASRATNVPGFILFELTTREAVDLLPKLKN